MTIKRLLNKLICKSLFHLRITELFTKILNRKFIILAYHQIDKKRFETHIKYLIKNGSRPGGKLLCIPYSITHSLGTC